MGSQESVLAVVRRSVGVEVVEEGRARGDTTAGSVERGGLFGGQMVAQSLSACAHTAPTGSVPDSIHARFLGASEAGLPVDFHVERVRDGRALQHRDVRGYQNGSLIVHATVTSSMPSGDADWQVPVMPVAGAPDLGPAAPTPWASGLSRGAFDVAYPAGTVDVRPLSHPLWFRASDELPDDPWLHGAVVSFWSDFGMNGAARFTYEDLFGPTSSVSATHSIWFHRRSPLRDWHLFDVEVQSLSGNQGFVRSSIFHEAGGLVASIDQGVFIRRPQAPE